MLSGAAGQDLPPLLLACASPLPCVSAVALRWLLLFR